MKFKSPIHSNWQSAIFNHFMQPEISHRCGSCGVSIREPAMFCPECGKALKPADTAPPAPRPGADTPSPAMATVINPEMVEAQTEPPSLEPVVAGPETARADLLSNKDEPGELATKPGHRGRAREKLHRASSVASNVARGALEDNVKRVEKIHHVSTAMIEEATYDASLRFVLVALGLFVIFVVLLVLSKLMG
jgi:hypothetical protein